MSIKNKNVMECPSCGYKRINYEEDGNWFSCPNCKECFAESDLRLQKQDKWHEGYNKGFRVGLKCAMDQLRSTADVYEKIISETI